MREPTKPGKWRVQRVRDSLAGHLWAVLLPSGIQHSTWWWFEDAIEIADDLARNGLR